MGPRRARLAGVAALLVVTAGCAAPSQEATPSSAGESSPAPSAGPSESGSAGAGRREGSVPANARSVPGPSGAAGVTPVVPAGLRPVRIAIPAIGVDAEIGELGLRQDGAIQVPGDARRTGWVTSTPSPGQQGPALIAGHVDSTTGPAVFYDLRTLEPGDAVTVTLRDGSTVDFAVDGLQSYPQDDFPSAAVYGPVPGPVLRLITCGGEYDPGRGGYQDNVVVYAS